MDIRLPETAPFGRIKLEFACNRTTEAAMSRQRILTVEDDAAIRRGIVDALRFAGYDVLEAGDGDSGMEMALRQHFDLLLLDLVLPGPNGFEILAEVRRVRRTLPVIILTARGDETDRVQGLHDGADDYVVKPFSPRELVARIRAVLRRHKEYAGKSDVVIEGPLVLDGGSHQVKVNEREISLTPMELSVLEILATHPGEVLSREKIIAMTQGENYEGYDRNIDTHVKNIRNKFCGEAKEWSFIETVYGVGYRFQVKEKE